MNKFEFTRNNVKVTIEKTNNHFPDEIMPIGERYESCIYNSSNVRAMSQTFPFSASLKQVIKATAANLAFWMTFDEIKQFKHEFTEWNKI